jgi:hypothetical protein
VWKKANEVGEGIPSRITEISKIFAFLQLAVRARKRK